MDSTGKILIPVVIGGVVAAGYIYYLYNSFLDGAKDTIKKIEKKNKLEEKIYDKINNNENISEECSELKKNHKNIINSISNNIKDASTLPGTFSGAGPIPTNTTGVISNEITNGIVNSNKD